MVAEELTGSSAYFRLKERCVWCDVIREERLGQRRLILERDGFVALAPYAPRLPFETWLLPTRHGSAFEAAELDELRALAGLLRTVLRRMGAVLHDPAYNFILHTAPLRDPDLTHFHWHLEIIPKLTRVAGFEWGSGFFINPVAPEEAAVALREAPG
jgi:UDPglucose--hexose-1-phosphate uridylyltransferase